VSVKYLSLIAYGFLIALSSDQQLLVFYEFITGFVICTKLTTYINRAYLFRQKIVHTGSDRFMYLYRLQEDILYMTQCNLICHESHQLLSSRTFRPILCFNNGSDKKISLNKKSGPSTSFPIAYLLKLSASSHITNLSFYSLKHMMVSHIFLIARVQYFY